MKGFIIYPTYRIIDGKSYACLYGRLENGDSFLTINHARPYFYIKQDDLDNALQLENFDYEETDFKDFTGNKVVKIMLDIPSQVPKLRELLSLNEIKSYEADVKYAYRFMIDNNLQSSMEMEGSYEPGENIDRVYKEPDIKPAYYYPKLNILSMDIESSPDGKHLYCVSLHSKNYSKVLVISKEKLKNSIHCKNERELLEKFVEELFMIDPDVITGWNLIDFDLAYLQQKFRQYKLPFNLGRDNSNSKIRIEKEFMRESKAEIVGRQVLDGLHLLRSSFIKVEDYKLDSVAKKVLGKRKLILAENKHELIDRYFKEDKQKLIDYCLNDAILVYEILEKTNTLELTIQRSLLTGMPLDRVNASIASLDSLYLKKAKSRQLVCPSISLGQREARITGGYVMEGKPGIYDNILVLDFKSLYSSLMRTFNIDPASHISKKEPDCIIAPNGAMFRNSVGILPEIIKEMAEHREQAKKKNDKLADFAIKIHLNSLFGVLANPACRFYNLDVANAITHFGQHIIKLTAKKIEEQGYDVIYSDSIVKDRYVTLLMDGILTIKNIEELFLEHKDKVRKTGDKEIILLNDKKIKALTLNKNTLKPEFSIVNEIIRHKTNKMIYRVNQKFGETICSEDHSIMVLENNNLKDVKPLELNNRPIVKVNKIPDIKEISKIDMYSLLKDYKYVKEYKGRKKAPIIHKDRKYVWFGWTNRKKPVKLKRFIKVGTEDFLSLIRLIGAYISEGASSTIETTNSRKGASIASSNKKWLEELQKDFHRLFVNTKTSIIFSTKGVRELRYKNNGKIKTVVYNDNTQKLQMMSELAAIFFKVLAGQKSVGKKLPFFVYHMHNKHKFMLLNKMIEGDGSRREADKRYSSSYKKVNFSYSTSSLQLISGLSLLLTLLRINYSIQYRPSKKHYTIVTSNKNNIRLSTKITKEKCNGYLYDLGVDGNNMFVDACGQLLLHNTDSVFINSKAKNYEEAKLIGMELQDFINKFYQDYVKQEYNRDSHLDLQFERCFIRFLMPMIRSGTAGAKKRYAGLHLKDGKEDILSVGIESVRSDWTDAAQEFQLQLLNKIFHKEEPITFIKKFVTDIKSGKYDDKLVYRKSIRKELKGYVKTTPPHVKAARQLDKLDSNIIEYYITEEGPEPIQKLIHEIDYDHYIDKQLKPIADTVLTFFNTDFNTILQGSKQSKLFEF